MSEWLAEGSGGFRPAFPLIAFGIVHPPRWIGSLASFSILKRAVAQPPAASAGVPRTPLFPKLTRGHLPLAVATSVGVVSFRHVAQSVLTNTTTLLYARSVLWVDLLDSPFHALGGSAEVMRPEAMR